MDLLYLLGAGLLLLAAGLDSLWTLLWVDGHAGPLTRRHTSWTRRVLWRVSGPGNHKLLSLTGPVVLVSTVLTWTLLLWMGWVVLFSADPGSLLHSQRHTPPDLMGRIYFAGSTMFTLGNGDYFPQGPWWELATAVASLSGLFLVTLTLTYLVSLLQAVVHKRSFASQILALGNTPEEFLLHAWTGHGFPALELQIVSLTEQLNTVSERHEAYPLLHYYHAAHQVQSVALGLSVFDEVLTLLAHGVREEVRPAPAAVHCARESVRLFLDTLKKAYVEPAKTVPPPPDLDQLRAAGIPVVDTAAFHDRLRETEHRRRLLLGFLEGEHRAWPGRRE